MSQKKVYIKKQPGLIGEDWNERLQVMSTYILTLSTINYKWAVSPFKILSQAKPQCRTTSLPWAFSVWAPQYLLHKCSFHREGDERSDEWWMDGRPKRKDGDGGEIIQWAITCPSILCSEYNARVCVSVGSLLTEMPTHANYKCKQYPSILLHH